MAKQCDHKSVGVIIKQDDCYAIIKRKNYPVAYAFVAGHLDQQSFEEAAYVEAAEEVGITIDALELRWEDTFANPCKRDDGIWHQWKIYEATKWHGIFAAGSDATSAHLIDHANLLKLAERTAAFQHIIQMRLEDLFYFVPAVTRHPEWQQAPGLEPVWYVILNRMGILPFYGVPRA